MSQCVPNWDRDDNPTAATPSLRAYSTAPDVPMLDYEVAELTWENGQLAMHGLGPPRTVTKPLSSSKVMWDKPGSTGGTLESIVNQATRFPNKSPFAFPTTNDELVPWLDHQRATAAATTTTMTMDALVPCAANRATTTTTTDSSTHVPDPNPGIGTRVPGCSTHVGSCSGAHIEDDGAAALLGRKRMRMAAAAPCAAVGAHEGSSMDHSVSGSATFCRDSLHVTIDTCDMENTSSGLLHTSCTKPVTVDDHDSVSHGESQPMLLSPLKRVGASAEKKKGQSRKSSISSTTKRSRAAAIHNQSERKRRDKINQRMKTLQKLVPNSSKTDKASMLDEVIDYLKQLQAQVSMMSRMNMPQMMLPMTMQQQLQMSMMAQMGMGMGMGMGVMDMNSMARPNITPIPPVLHPSAFMPFGPWDGYSDHRLPAASTAHLPDPLSTFLSQSQPMTMDAYSRMAALYQQLLQPQATNSKS